MTAEALDQQPATRSRKLSPFLKWGLIALVQLTLIALPLIGRLDVQISGKEVTLALVPVDPRDLLRGDYVIINLAIARVSIDLPGANEVKEGDRVYVRLAPGTDGVMRAASVDKAPDASGTAAMAGTVRSVGGSDIRIDYGIDAFFLPEGDGLIIEDLDTERVNLVVAVTEDGRSLPLRLLVDGKPFKNDAAF
ncbi:GDYXXLXY domain-containing protein [Roseibium alexandrii]|uniref:GDYXXLXY domain-containing protein n=1 Tax=Roseibium alexandrii TaxID=388408 RepID=UPI003752D544